MSYLKKPVSHRTALLSLTLAVVGFAGAAQYGGVYLRGQVQNSAFRYVRESRADFNERMQSRIERRRERNEERKLQMEKRMEESAIKEHPGIAPEVRECMHDAHAALKDAMKEAHDAFREASKSCRPEGEEAAIFDDAYPMMDEEQENGES